MVAQTAYRPGPPGPIGPETYRELEKLRAAIDGMIERLVELEAELGALKTDVGKVMRDEWDR